MPIEYAETPEHLETLPLQPQPPTRLPELNGTLLPQPAPPALPINDPMDTLALVVERCLGRTPKDERYRRALAPWLAGRHPERTEAWWLAQWGLKLE